MKRVMQQAMAEPHKPIPLFCWCCIFAMGLSWSGIAKAGIGDTYFCDVKEWNAVKDGKVVSYMPQRFMFQWKSDQIVFGKGGYFEDAKMPLIRDSHFPSLETFTARDKWSSLQFVEGRFRYVTFNNCSMPCDGDEVAFLVADCSSF